MGRFKPQHPDDYSPSRSALGFFSEEANDIIDDPYPDPDLRELATQALALRHPEEVEQIYHELEHKREVQALLAEIQLLEDRIEKQRQMNPQGVNVPALSETNGQILQDIKRIANDVKTLEAQLAKERELNPDGVNVPKVLETLKFQGLDVLVDSTVVKT